MTADIAIVTCADLPRGDEDGELLSDALRRRGMTGTWAAWDDPAVAWSAFDLVLVRSPWDYTLDHERFLRWAHGVDGLENPAAVLTWNSDKAYLRDLAEDGVAIVPTMWAAPFDGVELPPGEFVVKPSVGAGSKGAGRFNGSDLDGRNAARAHIRALHAARRTVMVQPYLAEVDTDGETGLIYFGGRFSHAVRKDAMLAAATANPLVTEHARPLFVPERISPAEPTVAELALGDQVVDLLRKRWGRDLVYARVDLLPTADGPVLIELEVTEPSLFLGHAAGSADLLAAAVEARLP